MAKKVKKQITGPHVLKTLKRFDGRNVRVQVESDNGMCCHAHGVLQIVEDDCFIVCQDGDERLFMMLFAVEYLIVEKDIPAGVSLLLVHFKQGNQ